MKRIAALVVIAFLMVPLLAFGQRRQRRESYPMMLGPKFTVGFFEGDESIYPVTFAGEMMLDLYRNQLWLRTNILELTAYENMNSLGINLGSPLEILFRGRYRDFYPYGFGGFGIGVNSVITDHGDETFTWAGITLGGGGSYAVSRYTHLFGEAGLDVTYSSGDWDGRLFLGLGARFELDW